MEVVGYSDVMDRLLPVSAFLEYPFDFYSSLFHANSEHECYLSDLSHRTATQNLIDLEKQFNNGDRPGYYYYYYNNSLSKDDKHYNHYLLNRYNISFFSILFVLTLSISIFILYVLQE